MPKFYKYLYLILFFTFGSACFGQEFRFDVINHEKGLYASSINKLYKDSRGLLWICADGAGLFSYNGNEFKNYNAINNAENLFVKDIIENNKNQLVLSLDFIGIAFFEGNKFIKTTSLNYKKNVETSPIARFIKNKNGIFGFSLLNIYFINNQNKVTNIKNIKNFGITKINAAELVTEQHAVLATDKGLFSYDIKNNQLLAVKNFGADVTVCKANQKNKIICGNDLGTIFELTFDNNLLTSTKEIITIVTKKIHLIKLQTCFKTLRETFGLLEQKKTDLVFFMVAKIII